VPGARAERTVVDSTLDRADGLRTMVVRVALESELSDHASYGRIQRAAPFPAHPTTRRRPIAPPLAAGEELLKCDVSDGVYSATFIVAKVDGNPVFFPVDDDTFTPASERMAAQIPPYYDATASWPYDLDAAGNKRQHNFSFTEVNTSRHRPPQATNQGAAIAGRTASAWFDGARQRA